MTTEKQIPGKLVDIIFNVLGEDNLHWFRIVKRLHGEINVVLKIAKKGRYIMPHPIHLREGMQIRNIMRQSGLCEGWDAHDFDNNWVEVVEKAIALLPTPHARRNGLPGMPLEKALECLKIKEDTTHADIYWDKVHKHNEARQFSEPAKIAGNAKWGPDEPQLAPEVEFAAVHLLRELLRLKDHKDTHGKDAHYQTYQPLAWKDVRDFLEHYDSKKQQ